ncbi:hypothetical protein ACOMHN_042689 [Nucella lapillus]
MDGTSEAEAREKDHGKGTQTCNETTPLSTPMTPSTQLNTGPEPGLEERTHPVQTAEKEQIHNDSGQAVNKDDSTVDNKSDTEKTEKNNNSRRRSDHEKNDNEKNVTRSLLTEDRAKRKSGGSKEKCSGKDTVQKGGQTEGDANPLNVDLYEKLRAENMKDNLTLQWESYLATEGLQKTCRRLFLSERQLYGLMMSIFMVVTFAMVFGLCVLQAQMSMTSKQLLSKVQGPKKPLPQGMYTLYYDYLDSGVLPENVDLRANTSIFVH